MTVPSFGSPWRMLLPALLVTVSVIAAGQSAEQAARVKEYVRRYAPVAVNEMKLYRIPASITLAQGIIESGAGTSKLATEANNHFGIKCHKGWGGKTYIQDDDEKDECFRKYSDPVESFRDHSHFLTGRDRYRGLFDLEITDYHGWAKGLKAAGYATNPKYAEMLVRTIETYSLEKYDRGHKSIPQTGTPLPGDVAMGVEAERGYVLISRDASGRDIFENNRLRMIIAREDDNIYLLARDFGISVADLLRYNELAFATSLKPGQIVYLEKKRRRAAVKYHECREGDTWHSVAQEYGIQLKKLVGRNKADDRMAPAAGTKLKLR